ncbi:MAG: hypothetical protein ACRBCK_04665 [Alphaproteobacteria bacterium]
MAKKFNKSGHSQTYQTSAGVHRRTTRIDGHLDPRKWVDKQNDLRPKHHRYNNSQAEHPIGSDNFPDEAPLLTLTPPVPMWHRSEQVRFQYSYDEAGWTSSTSDFEDKAAKKSTKIFIALQGTAALGLAATGVLSGDFSKFNDNIITGMGHLSETMDKGSLATGGGNALRNVGWYQSHARLPKRLAVIGTAPSDLANKSLETLFKSSFNLDPRKQNKDYEEPVFLTKRKEQATEKKQAIESFAESSVGKEIIHARINSSFAGLGSLVHIPQALHGAQMMAGSGDLNGHLIGGSAAIIGYGLMAADQMIEARRWKEQIGKISSDTTITHEMSHNLVGYVARGEYLKDFAFKWLPSMHLSAKGGAYIWEASHMQSFSEMASHASSLSTDVNIAAATLLATGVIFSSSAAYEYIEQNGKKVSYIARKGAALTTDSAQNVADDIKNGMKNELIRAYNNSSQHNPLYQGITATQSDYTRPVGNYDVDDVDLEVVKSLSPYNEDDHINPEEYLSKKRRPEHISFSAEVSEDGKVASVTLNNQVDHTDDDEHDQNPDDDIDYSDIYIEPS